MTALSRLSLNTETTHHLTLRDAIDVASRAGLGGIGPWRHLIQEVGIDEAARMLADSGLAVTTLCRGGFLTASDASAQQAALDDNRRAIDEAAAIGARELVMVVGGIPASFAMMGRNSGDAVQAAADALDKDVAAARARVAERIADLIPHTRAAGVRLVLEPMHPLFTADRGVLTTLDQCLDIAAPFAADEVAVVADTYHVWWDPRLRSALLRAGAEGRLASYQVCDWSLPLAQNTLNSRAVMGEGFIDFPTITRWVEEAGYDGLVEVEIFNEGLWALPGEEIVARIAKGYETEVLPHL